MADEPIKTDCGSPVVSSALLAEAIALLRVAKCPNCDGSGAIPRQTSSRQLVTREMASDACCPEMEGSLYSDDEWELEQCQWCYERHGLLDRYTANQVISNSVDNPANAKPGVPF